MKENEFLDGVSNIAPDVVERFVSMDNKLQKQANKSKSKGVWLRFGAIAACFLLIVSAVIVVPMLREDSPGVISEPETTDDNNSPNIPIVNIQTPSNAPQYYGSESSSGMSGEGQVEVDPTGICVTAKIVEVLPDVYTFFDDWEQNEFGLLHMRTVKLLRGKEMTEEFYYLVPVNFLTDFTVFDSFVIKDMAQFSYEYSVMYNKTQGTAEQLNLIVFGYRIYGYTVLGANFMAFDSNGNFDEGMWNSNVAWKAVTERAQIPDSIDEVEKAILEDEWKQDLYAHLLNDISGEARNALEQIKTFDNGIFVPRFSNVVLWFSPEVQFYATRYINGFATNEKVSVWCKEWTGGDQDTYTYTKARFNEEDMNRLPDLVSGFESVKGALSSGSITPPHFENQEELRNTTSGVFGWYAKTENGVIGIVRVTWCFYSAKYQFYYDDAYYIVEYGVDECKPISRDNLLEMLGDYESTYIYTGEYNEYGKYSDRVYPEI